MELGDAISLAAQILKAPGVLHRSHNLTTHGLQQVHTVVGEVPGTWMTEQQHTYGFRSGADRNSQQRATTLNGRQTTQFGVVARRPGRGRSALLEGAPDQAPIGAEVEAPVPRRQPAPGYDPQPVAGAE